MLPPPVEVVLGTSALQGASVAVLEILPRRFQALIDMANAALGILIDLPPHFRGFPSVGSKMQLGLKLRPSCNALVAFRFRYNA